MARSSRTACLILAVALLGGVRLRAELRPSGVAGRVLGESRPPAPLATAGVYAYQLADLTLHKVMTDAQGNFLFQDLPAGLYKIIAHKPGFMPAVILITRSTAQAYQFLELQLAERDRAHPELAGDDYWTLRSRIPGDVLRDIETGFGASAVTADAAPLIAGLSGLPGANGDAISLKTIAAAESSAGANFHTEVQAVTGHDQVTQLGAGQVSGGRLGIEGRLGPVHVGLRGRFSQVNTEGFMRRGAADGQTSAVWLDLQAGSGSRISLTSTNNHLAPRAESGTLPIAFEHYGVAWSQALSEHSHSDFLAQYTNESNFSRQGPIDPAIIPGASRTWRVEGSYSLNWSDSSTLQAGVRYRERQLGLAPAGTSAPLPGQLAQANLDVYGRGGTRIQPAVLVEYGLYNTLRDGRVALAPQGGVVLELGEGWQLHGSASKRVYENRAILPQFVPTLFRDAEICEQGARSCYQVELSHHFGDDGAVSLSAVQRSIGDTLRLYFSDEFFDRLESLYLVPGDRVPEVRFALSERLAPKVRTTFASSVAAGGGGTSTSPSRLGYRNHVRYMVTSLDTRFLHTATGVFIALHQVRQGLTPLVRPELSAGLSAGGPSNHEAKFDRLQLLLTQDLNVLFNLAGDWAIQLNMEISRDSAPYLSLSDRQLHKRVLGGIAVKF